MHCGYDLLHGLKPSSDRDRQLIEEFLAMDCSRNDFRAYSKDFWESSGRVANIDGVLPELVNH